MMDLRPDQLAALRSVVEEGSFERAAAALSLTQSAVSQRIKALETSVGAVLVTRSRPARATETGEVLLQLGRSIDLLSREALQRIGASEAGRAEVSVAVNADSLATWFLPAVAPLADRISLRALREDEGHTAALLRDGSAMAAITSDRDPVQGCSVELLGAMRYRPRASRAFVESWFGQVHARGARPNPDALRAAYERAPVVAFDEKDDMQDARLRALGIDAGGVPHSFVPASVDMAEAVALGFGWAMIPDLQAPDDGRELVAFDDAGVVDAPLYWQQWRLRSSSLDALAGAVRAAAATVLRPPP